MKLGSLFDGSGTAPLAAVMCSIEPVWASEIEPYPIKVTQARFPNMLHLGDITKINGAEVEPVDIICGGSPCQDLSVAGKQKGLQDGERSHLFYEMTRIIKEMRKATDGKYPKYIIWENVPGAFSSNNGRDFHSVLQAFAEIADPDVYVPEPPCKGKTDRLAWRYAGSIVGDGWSIAWRTVDAQYWGVPQRRRRIYLVADFADECAGEILFEREGLSGHSEPSGTQRKNAAEDAGRSVEGSCRVKCFKERAGKPGGGKGILIDDLGKSFTLSTMLDQSVCMEKDFKEPQCVVFEPKSMLAENWSASEVKNALRAGESKSAHAVICKWHKGAADTPLCVFDITGTNSNSMKSPTPDSCFRQRDVARTLDSFVASPECNQGGNVVVETVGALCARDYKGVSSQYVSEGKCIVQKAVCIGNGDGKTSPHTPNVVYQNTGIGWWNESRIAETLRTPCGGDATKANPAVFDCHSNPNRKYIVRRLTPLECCRLQGFPDWWEDGVEGSDSARYKMWGNGMALPNMLHVMQGIARVEGER